MRIYQIVYTLKAFMEERTRFSNTLQVLLGNTNWSAEMFAAYFEVDLKTFQQWLTGENIPSREEQVRYIESIAQFMDIDIELMADTLKKLELNHSSPNNDTFVDAMLALDFTVFNKEIVGKAMFGPAASARQAGTLISDYKKRRRMPKKALQADLSLGAAKAIEVQFLRPFESVTKVDDVKKLTKPEILPPSVQTAS